MKDIINNILTEMDRQLYPSFKSHNNYHAATPYVNLNGNGRDDLINNAQQIVTSLNNLRKLVAKSDLAHMRNAMTTEHGNTMKKDQNHDFDLINELHTKYIAILHNLTED